jgi:hypothetical protein
MILKNIKTFIGVAISMFLIILEIGFAQIEVEVSKSDINFGTHAFCQRPTDTIVVRNKSTSTGNLKLLVGEKITGANNTSFRITNLKIKDLDLPPYDGTNAVIYVVEFNPSVGASGPKTGMLEIPTDLPTMPLIKIPLTATSENVDYKVTPKPLDFGDIATGTAYNQNINFQITSNLNVHITKITKTKPELTLDLTGFNYTLTSTDASRTFGVNINLPAQGKFNDTVKIHCDLPCDTVLSIPILANGLPSAISANLNYDFGLLSDCEVKEMNATISFSGAGSGKIESVGVIDGPLANLFSISFPSALPITLNNTNTSVQMKITYIGNGADFGNANVNIPLNITVNSNSSTMNFKITGEVAEPKIAADKLLLDYQTIFAFTSKSIVLNISNNSKFDINLTGYKFTGNYPAFFDFNPVFTPKIIQKGTQEPLTVYFTPLLPKIAATGKLTIYYSSKNCTDSIVVDLLGNTYDSGGLKFSFNDKTKFEIDPKSNLFNLPLTLKPTAGTVLLNDSIEVEITFPRNVYYPESINSTNTIRVDKNVISGSDRVYGFTVIFNNLSVPTGIETKFAEIQGIPLLAEQKESQVKINKLNFKSGSKLVSIDSIMDTKLSLKICEAGGERLIKVTQVQNGGIIQILEKNEDKISLLCSMLEKGMNRINLIDLHGKLLNSQEFYSDNNAKIDINFDLTNYSAGVYFIVLETVSEKYSLKFVK